MRIAFVSCHPAPYRDPLLRRLTSEEPKFRTDVYCELSFDAGHSFWNLENSGYEMRPLFDKGQSRLMRFYACVKNLVLGRYDLIVWSGFMHAETTLACLLCAIIGKRYAFTADTVKSRSRGGVRRLIKGFIARRASFILVPGLAGIDFWHKEFGIPTERILKGAYALDGAKIAETVEKRRQERDLIREKYGIAKDAVVFLMVANMIPTRHYQVTAEGFLKFVKAHSRCQFVAVGRGPELDRMQSLSQRNPELVVVPGCSFNEMLSLYSAADVYVHGGTEPASTALVIGAISGLPIISSDAVGCSYDVLEDGESGLKVGNYLSSDDWCTAFEKMLKARENWSGMGHKARVLSRVLDVDAVYSGILGRIMRTVV